MQLTRTQIMGIVAVIAGLLVGVTLIAERMGIGSYLSGLQTSPLQAGRKLAKPEGEVRDLEQRYEARRARSVKEAEALVRNMEQQAQDQRVRLNEIENDLEKARDLLERLKREPAIGVDSGTPPET